MALTEPQEGTVDPWQRRDPKHVMPDLLRDPWIAGAAPPYSIRRHNDDHDCAQRRRCVLNCETIDTRAVTFNWPAG